MTTTAGEGSILSPGEHATSATAGDSSLATADDAEARRLAAVVIEKLRRDPLLLESDPDAESLVSTVVGRPVRGSWWGHPDGALIYRVAGVVLAHPDVTETKLLAGKVTLVHRALWPRVVAVGVAREDWQTGGLSPQAVALLAAVDAAGEVRTDAADAPRTGTVAAASTPKAARELERALLVHAEQVHSASGAHAKVLRTWDRWSAAHGVTEPLPPVRAAKDELNRVLGRLNQRWGTRLRLPWPSGGGRP